MTTDEAFNHLLKDEYLWKRTGLSDSRRRALKSLTKNGRATEITLDKKIQLLEKVGFYKKQDIDWGLEGGFER